MPSSPFGSRPVIVSAGYKVSPEWTSARKVQDSSRKLTNTSPMNCGKVDGHVIGSADALVAAVQSKAPGAQTSLGFVDPSGNHRTVVVTLGTDQGRQ
jgi:hypothetical protein